jgi:LacI family transcriptional regulator
MVPWRRGRNPNNVPEFFDFETLQDSGLCFSLCRMMSNSDSSGSGVVPPVRRRVLVLLAWYATDVFRGIARFARDAGWILDSSYERTGEVPAGWRGDGIIGVLGVHPEVDQLAVKSRVPFVNIGYSMPEAAPSVSADQTAVARLAANHFRNRGFRHFAYYLRSDQPGDLGRLEAFRRELASTGHQPVVINCNDCGGGSSLARTRWLARKLKALPKPVAILAEIDDYAIEVIGAAADAGLAIPEEVAVLGVGNDELRCPFAQVPLSSVNDNACGIGQQACLLLERLMTGASTPVAAITVQPLGMVTRRSTDVVAVEHPQVAQALKAIRDHYRDPMTAEGIISGVPMSRRRLHDAFVRHIGRSVADEITRLRVEHAKRLLAETPEKQHQVAVQSGFRNDARLVLVFTRVTGMTPGEYRRIFNPAFASVPKLGRPPGSGSHG